jgi:hypothetical protein
MVFDVAAVISLTRPRKARFRPRPLATVAGDFGVSRPVFWLIVYWETSSLLVLTA